MHATWRVDEVTEKPGVVLATLTPVEWFKKNPDYEAAMELPDGADDPDPFPEEFIDAEPDEDGAQFIEVGKAIILDISTGPDMHPLDNVRLTLDAVVTVDA